MKTTDENYFKAVCIKCGVNVETPNELYDQTVECPDCGESFLARPKDLPLDPPPHRVFIPKSNPDSKLHPAILIVGLTILGFSFFYFIATKFGDEAVSFMGIAIPGLLAVALTVVLFFLSVLWIVFPMFVYFGMRRVEKILNQIEANTRKRN